MEWIRNIEVISKSNEASKAAFIGELNKRFEPKDDEWWEEVRNGSNRKSKWLAMEICQIFAYYDQYFTKTELSCIYGVLPDNHNTKLAIDKLIDLRILRKTTNDEGTEVYVLVDMLKYISDTKKMQRQRIASGKFSSNYIEKATVLSRQERNGREITTVMMYKIPTARKRKRIIVYKIPTARKRMRQTKTTIMMYKIPTAKKRRREVRWKT